MAKKLKLSGETPGFEVKDILVSRTDDRGIILAANEVFQRISGYEWTKLYRSPHKVVRHPGMPKGVFWLFWDALQRKKPIGAFVKNRSKDGTYYWVYAFAAPQGKGYISVRVKPTDEAVSLISTEYAALLKREKEEKLSPQKSGQILLERIKELGYRDYAHFMAQMALEQTSARMDALDRVPSQMTMDMARLTTLWAQVRKDCDGIFQSHELISHTPTNLSVQAAHLHDRGIPLSYIASNFAVLANEITEMMNTFIVQAERVEERLNKGAYLVCTEHLMEEVVNIFQSETAEMPGIDRKKEIKVMMKQRSECFDKTVRALDKVSKEIGSFGNILEETSRVLSGLSVAKVMCEIENTYVGTAPNSSVNGILEELEVFQNDTRSSLFAIRQHLFEIKRTINMVLSQIAGTEAA